MVCFSLHDSLKTPNALWITIISYHPVWVTSLQQNRRTYHTSELQTSRSIQINCKTSLARAHTEKIQLIPHLGGKRGGRRGNSVSTACSLHLMHWALSTCVTLEWTFSQLFTKALPLRRKKTTTLELPCQRSCSAKEGRLEYPSSPAFSHYSLLDAHPESLSKDGSRQETAQNCPHIKHSQFKRKQSKYFLEL